MRKGGPFFERRCSQGAVKVHGRLVPVDHQPLDTGAVARQSDSRQLSEERAPHAPATQFRAHEQVFQENAAPAAPAREIVEEHGEARDLFAHGSEQHLDSPWGSRTWRRQATLY
jgi:hypothetical protein